ncbi:MAG: hypothetical protein GY830_01225 [Bacteroidetes bacterium]|nr:hypothetical protein [Bacteroidota bacterium]
MKNIYIQKFLLNRIQWKKLFNICYLFFFFAFCTKGNNNEKENNNEASSIEKLQSDKRALEQKLENYKTLDDKQKTETDNKVLALDKKIWDNEFNLILEVVDYCKTLIKQKKTVKQMEVLLNQKFKNKFEKGKKLKMEWENKRKNLDEQIKDKMNKEAEVQSEKHDKILKQRKNKLILLIDKQNYEDEDEEKVKMKEFVNNLGQ